MTGLFDIFGRHFAVLTNFLEIVLNSRLIGQEAAFPGREGPVQGGTRRVPTGPRRGGTGPGRAPEAYPTHSRPCAGPSGARFAGYASPRAAWLGTGITPPPYLPGPIPRYTHPVPYPPVTRTTPVTSTTGACTYDRFWDTVGEPRGLRTHARFRVPDGLYTVIYFYTAV